MEFVVVDLEWNQYPGSARAPVSRSGFVMVNEIVQFGAVRTDEKFRILDTFSANVHLSGNRRLSWQVARVISMTEREMQAGMRFSEAYRAFRRFCDGAQGIFSWGIDDQKVLLSNTQFYRLPPVHQAWYDAQNLYRGYLKNPNMRTSLENAVEHFGLNGEDRQAHDALSDAESAARVLAAFDAGGLLSRYDEFSAPSPRRGLASGTTPVFLKQNQAREHARSMYIPCPQCGGPLRFDHVRFGRREDWQEARSCEAHGEYVVRFHLRCRSQRYFSVLYSIHPLDDPMRRAIERRRQQLAEKPPENDARD